MAKAADIGAALKARLNSLVFNPAIPVAWPNKDYEPDGTRFLAAQIEHSPNQRLTITAEHRYSGLFVVTVCNPNRNGSGEGDGIADAVAAHFPADMKLPTATGSVRIVEAPSVRGGFRDGGYWRTPVVIPFEVLN